MQLAQSVSECKGRAIFCQKHLNPKVLNILKRLLNNLQVLHILKPFLHILKVILHILKLSLHILKSSTQYKSARTRHIMGSGLIFLWFGWLHSREVELLLNWVVHP